MKYVVEKAVYLSYEVEANDPIEAIQIAQSKELTEWEWYDEDDATVLDITNEETV